MPFPFNFYEENLLMFRITKIYLLFLFIFLSGCSHKKILISDSNFSTPQDELYSLKGDLNSTDIPSFQSIVSIKGLKKLVDKGLQKEPPMAGTTYKN